MKRTVFFTCLILVISSCFALVHAAEIYWDGISADDEITDEDFKYNYGDTRSTKSLADLGIYDDNMVINVEGPDDVPAGEYDTAAPAPIAPRSIQPPAAPSATTRQRDVTPQSTQREPAGGTNIMRRLERAPKPQPQGIESKPAAPAPASVEQPSPAAEKKMKWGQQESNSSDIKAKFQWGQKRQ